MSTPDLLAAPNATSLTIRPWLDDVIDALGFDPRSAYVENFWLGILGPSTTWLMRRIATGLEAQPTGFTLDLSDCARRLGLGDRGGRHSPFMRALTRLVQFDLAQPYGVDALAVRRRIPPLNRRQVNRLPDSLQAQHHAWQRAQLQTPPEDAQRQRCRQLAMSLLEVGEDIEAVERQLLRWRFHPALAHQSARWAHERHAIAAAAVSAEAAAGHTDADGPEAAAS